MNENAVQQSQTTQGQTSQVISAKSKPGMSRFTKIAIVAGATVVIVIIAEVAYILFNRNTGLLTRETPQGQTAQVVQKEPQAPPPTPVSAQQTSDLNQVFVENLLLAFENLNAKPGFVNEATTLITIQGRVRNARDATDIAINGQEVAYLIELENDSGQTVNYFFTEQEFAIASAVLVGTSGQGAIAIREIQPGDNLLIRQYKNLLEPSVHSTRISIEVRRP